MTWDEDGLAVWAIRMAGTQIPGYFVIVDREFRPAAG